MKISPETVAEMKPEIERRIREVNRNSYWADKEILPNDDLHVRQFSDTPTEHKVLLGRVGYCFQPLIKEIYRALNKNLAFAILMYSPEQLEANARMGKLSFCAFNNRDEDLNSQLRFRKIFRFVGAERFSDVGIQTSKILFEKADSDSADSDQVSYVYSFQDTAPEDSPEGVRIVPVGPLLRGVLDSFYFQNLKNYLTHAVPEDIRDEMAKQFKRFYEDGDLEKYVIQRGSFTRSTQVTPSEPSESYAVITHIDEQSLFAFERLLKTFELRSSTDLRRRFLNYLTWMLLCDEHVRSYSYSALLDKKLPRAELVVASRDLPDIDFLSQVKGFAIDAFKQIEDQNHHKKSVKRPVADSTVHETTSKTFPVTLKQEREAIQKYFIGPDWHGSDVLQKGKAVFGLDEALLRYVGPIVTRTFLTPYKHLSLDPFWSDNKAGKPNEFRQFIADLTLTALREEFLHYQRNAERLEKLGSQRLPAGSIHPISRVNPFLMAMSPVAEYLAQEMKAMRKAVTNPTDDREIEERRLGEAPLDESGLLSMNVVFWDIATTRFRYCSVWFISNDPVFDYSFRKFFRLIDVPGNADLKDTDSSRGILKNVLLMSDVLFRESKGKIEPVCIVFQDSDTVSESSGFSRLEVGEYINYLRTKEVRKSFERLYQQILVQEEDANGREKSQELFNVFCFDPNEEYGVWDFLRHGGDPAKALVERTQRFFKTYGLKDSGTLETVARFLGYITWLWLCYNERLAYYYYIPAQLPFNDRIGGFAIATETPIPNDILDFLFVSIVPRIVAHPALLHHREAVTQLSRAVQQCWFDSLLHLIRNSYGIEAIDRDLEDIGSGLNRIRSLVGTNHNHDVDELRALVTDAQQQMEKIPALEGDLKKMFDDEQSSLDRRLMTPSDVITLSARLSSKFAQTRGVPLNFLDGSSSRSEIVENHAVHSPIVLVLWHLILNACEAVEKLPEPKRRVMISSKVNAQTQQVIISVKNFASASVAERLKNRDHWTGLQKDQEVLQVLWKGTLTGTVPDEPLGVDVRSKDKELAEVEVSINAPAIPISAN